MTIAVPPALADRVVRPGSAQYPLLRSTYTRVHSPAAVVLPRTPGEVRAALEVADLRAAIDAVGPDVVVIDTNCWGAPAVAEAVAAAARAEGVA